MDLHLHEKQSLAFSSRATELFYGGAAGGGKSHLIRVAMIAWCYAIPGLQAYLFRRTFPDLMKNHMEGPAGFPVILSEWVAKKYANITYGNQPHIEFSNGSKIHLCHCQHEKNIWNYQGAEIHLLCIDELTQWIRSMYVFLRSRLRIGGLSVPDQYKGQFPRALLSANPGGIGHNWVRHDFVDFGPAFSMIRMDASQGGMLRQRIPARLEDNPTLLENDPDYEARLEGLGDKALVRAMRRGDWNIVAGGLLDDVWDESFHVIRPFSIPKRWRIDRSFDWGSSKPFSVAWWAESDGDTIELLDGKTRCWPKGTLFRIAEWYGWNGNPNEGCKMLSTEIARGILDREKAMGLSGRVRPGPADSSIFDVQEGDSIADKMARIGVRWERADKSSGSRVNGAEMIRTRLKAALQHPMEDPGLFVFETCRHFIRTVPTLPRDPNKTDDANTNAEDHVYDEVRYRIMSRNKQAAQAHVVGLY